MAEWVKVANVNDLRPGSAMTAQAKGLSVALYNVEGKVYATSNTCAHRGGPLGEGMMEGNRIVCPWHGWEYDVTDGKCVTMPAARVQTYKTKLEGKDIYVEV